MFLRKQTGQRKTTLCVSYIPQKFAKADQVIKLRDDYGNWSDGWIVKHAGEITDVLPNPRKAIKGHKTRTLDNMPKEPKK